MNLFHTNFIYLFWVFKYITIICFSNSLIKHFNLLALNILSNGVLQSETEIKFHHASFIVLICSDSITSVKLYWFFFPYCNFCKFSYLLKIYLQFL